MTLGPAQEVFRGFFRFRLDAYCRRLRSRSEPGHSIGPKIGIDLWKPDASIQRVGASVRRMAQCRGKEIILPMGKPMTGAIDPPGMPPGGSSGR
jgi:hypothetical protein